MNHKSTEALLEGERLAFKIIQNARDEKNTKVQDAQFEAKLELALIQQKFADEFDAVKAEKQKESLALNTYAEKAEGDKKKIRAQFEANKGKILDILTDSILTVQISLPKVVVGNFEEMDAAK